MVLACLAASHVTHVSSAGQSGALGFGMPVSDDGVTVQLLGGRAGLICPQVVCEIERAQADPKSGCYHAGRTPPPHRVDHRKNTD